MKAAIPVIPEFMDLDLLARLPSLEVRARFLVQGFLAGMHRSPLRGFNVEFKEFRSYEPGDEPRTIDWKVFARTDRLQVKVREQDTNLTAYIAVDASSSMNYRSPGAVMSKWEFARSVAAALVLLLARQRDAASLAVIGTGGLRFSRPSLKASAQRRMMAALDRNADGPGGSLAAALSHLKRPHPYRVGPSGVTYRRLSRFEKTPPLLRLQVRAMPVARARALDP